MDMTHIDPERGNSKKHGNAISENVGKYVLEDF